jgi:hypothetical protein
MTSLAKSVKLRWILTARWCCLAAAMSALSTATYLIALRSLIGRYDAV